MATYITKGTLRVTLTRLRLERTAEVNAVEKRLVAVLVAWTLARMSAGRCLQETAMIVADVLRRAIAIVVALLHLGDAAEALAAEAGRALAVVATLHGLHFALPALQIAHMMEWTIFVHLTVLAPQHTFALARTFVRRARFMRWRRRRWRRRRGRCRRVSRIDETTLLRVVWLTLRRLAHAATATTQQILGVSSILVAAVLVSACPSVYKGYQ